MLNRALIYTAGLLALLFLITTELASVYFIMPFPGSQQDETINTAYWIYANLNYLRLAGLVVAAYPLLQVKRASSGAWKITSAAVLVVYAAVFLMVNYRLRADVMFLQPRQLIRVQPDSNRVDRQKLVIGIEVNGVAHAYPIEIVGYHHQIRDTVGGESVMITYCTVCRSGRVFSPVVNGQPENFRLVGMDHFNAMFEDSRTRSWWRQATGEAVAGPLKSAFLREIPSQQMSLLAWIDRYPDTWIIQPDPEFADEYAELEKYDEGTIKSSLEGRDTASWQPKSWVVGIRLGNTAKAYDWNLLREKKIINDSLGDVNVAIALESDQVSFHAWQRDSLIFTFRGHQVLDVNTGSVWNWRGQCTDGPLKGAQLKVVQSYQEFWHSWQTFHPKTLRYEP